MPPPIRPQSGNDHPFAAARDVGPGKTANADHGPVRNSVPQPAAGASAATEIFCANKAPTTGPAGDTLPDPAAGYWPSRRTKPAGENAYAAAAASDGARPPDAAAAAPKISAAMPALRNSAMPRLADENTGGAGSAVVPGPMPAAVSDADVEHIHSVIKKLADELRTAKSVTPSEARAAGSPSAISRAAAIAAGAEALITAAEAMRGVGALPAVAADTAHPASEFSACPGDCGDLPASPSVPPAQGRFVEIAAAVAAARLDVYLEPILGLSDLRARHYEVSVRLRSQTGESMTSEEFTPAARGTGLLPLIDALRVSRSARVAARMGDRGATGSLFSLISGEALASNRFLREFADTYHQGEVIAERLVLSFAQDDVRGFAAPQWATLKELADLGFRFALEDVSDLDMDFETLTAAGFAFAKIEARVFLEGLPAQGGLIPASDLCRYLASLGLTLIVGRMEVEAQLARVLGFGALFGQGMLFGAPRPVKSEILRPSQGVAA